jgi:hypothetical protein
MKDPVPALLVSIVVSLGVGFIMGHFTAGPGAIVLQTPQQPAVPVNYSPERALCADAIKEAQAGQERCWTALLDERRKEIGH